jgi:hypothetical protein
MESVAGVLLWERNAALHLTVMLDHQINGFLPPFRGLQHDRMWPAKGAAPKLVQPVVVASALISAVRVVDAGVVWRVAEVAVTTAVPASTRNRRIARHALVIRSTQSGAWAKAKNAILAWRAGAARSTIDVVPTVTVSRAQTAPYRRRPSRTNYTARACSAERTCDSKAAWQCRCPACARHAARACYVAVTCRSAAALRCHAKGIRATRGSHRTEEAEGPESAKPAP